MLVRRSPLKIVFHIFDRLGHVSGSASAVGLIIAMLVVSYDVLMRFVFNRPTSWGNEVSSYLLLFLGSFAIVYALNLERHIRAEIIYIRLSRKWQRVADLITLSLALVFYILATWKGFRITLLAFRGGWVHDGLFIVPKWFTYGIIILCFFLMCLQLFSKIYERFLNRLSPGTKPSSEMEVSK